MLSSIVAFLLFPHLFCAAWLENGLCLEMYGYCNFCCHAGIVISFALMLLRDFHAVDCNFACLSVVFLGRKAHCLPLEITNALSS